MATRLNITPDTIKQMEELQKAFVPVNKAIALIKKATKLGILYMPDENSVAVFVCYEDGSEQWEQRNLLSAAIDLSKDKEGQKALVEAIDEKIENLWLELTDVSMNPETEKIEEDFLHFPAGTDRADIWHWFNEQHSKGILYLVDNIV